MASLEFRFPHFKGELPASRAVVKGWGVSHHPRHTVPMGRGPARLFAVHMVAMAVPFLGIALLLQRELGMRPSEVLGLEREDVALPEHQFAPQTLRAVLALGMRTGTKAKRAQAVLLTCPLLIGLLRHVVRSTQAGYKLFPFSYATYRRVIQRIGDKLDIKAGYTPHSAIAGFASESISDGVPFHQVKEWTLAS